MDRNELTRPWWLLPPGRLHPLWWWAIALALVLADYLVGPSTQFPVLYVIPVSLAAWYSGRGSALAIAVAVPLAHLVFLVAFWKVPGEAAPIAATMLRAGAIAISAMWVARLAEHERALERYVYRLEGLLPICAFCKSIRNSAGEWEPFEVYITTRSKAEFSHGFCPSCGRTHYQLFEQDEAS